MLIQKHQESLEIARQTDIFLANGGIIKTIPLGVTTRNYMESSLSATELENIRASGKKGAIATKRRFSINRE